MVVKEPTTVDFVLVIEATANLVTHWEMIKKLYIRPAIEHFNGQQPSEKDYIGNNRSSQFGYVLFSTATRPLELMTKCSHVTQSPWSFVNSLDDISLTGGGCERMSPVSEGLGRALKLFDGLAKKRGQGQSKKICFLICNSPPYDLPCSESFEYNGHNSEKLAEFMGEKGINLSVISPQRIRSLKQIYLAANQNKLPTMNYAQDPRHLVLISGFQLPTEHIPVKLNEDQKQTKPSPINNSLSSMTITSSVPSPQQHHNSPVSTLTQDNMQNSLTRAVGNSQQQPISSVPQSLPIQLDAVSGISTTASASINGSNVAQPMTTQIGNVQGNSANNSMPSASPGNMMQTNFQQLPQSNNQTQIGQMNFGNNAGKLSQQQQQQKSGANSPFSRGSIPQSSATGTMNTVNNLQTRPSQGQLLLNDVTTFGGQSENTNISVNNNMGVMPSVNMKGSNDQTMFNTSIQNNVMQDQGRMTQSIASRMADQSAIGTGSPNMQQQQQNLTYSNVMNPNMQGNQQPNPNIMANTNNVNGNTFTGSNNSMQRVDMTNNQPQINIGGMRPNFNNAGNMLTSQSNTVGMMPGNNNSSQQINNSSMQMNQQIVQPQQQQVGMINTNANMGNMIQPHSHSMPNQMPGQMQPNISTKSAPFTAANDIARSIVQQANNVSIAGTMQPQQQQQQDNMRLAWDGTLEWTEKRKIPSGIQHDRTTHTLSCKVYLRANQTEENINTSTWPTKLNMQLIPQMVFTSMRDHMRNNTSVSLRMAPTDQMRQLAALMKNKWVGLIQIPNQGTNNNKVMLIIYSLKNLQFFGVLPLDSQNFLAKIRDVIMASNQRRPQANVQPAQLSDVGSFQSQPNTSLQTPFMSAQQGNMRPNLNAGNMRAMNPIQQSNRVTINQGIPARGNMQPIQTNVNAQQQNMNMNFIQQQQQPGMRMPNNPQQMTNQGMVMNNMQQSQQIQQRGQMQQQGINNSQQHNITYQSNMGQQRTMVQNQNPNFQQQQRLRQQQQQQQQMTNRIGQMATSHNIGETQQLRTLLQANTMSQNMNQSHPRMMNMNSGMRPQGVRYNIQQNQQVRHTMPGNRMISMQQQQQRFNMQ